MSATQRERRLQQDVGLIETIYDAAPIGVAVWNIDGRLVHPNPVFCQLVGRDADELRGSLFDELIHPQDTPGIVGKIADVWSGRRNYFECDLRCVSPDGVVLWLRAYLAPVYGPSAEPEYLISHVFNFGGRGERDSVLRQMANNSPVMLWLTDERGRPRLGNRPCFEFLGVHQPSGDFGQVWADALHPGDLAAAEPEIRVAVEERRSYELVARSRRRDGEWRWLHHRANPIFDASGMFEGYAGGSIDITGSEQDRAELHEPDPLGETPTDVASTVTPRADRLASVLDASLDYVVIGVPTGAITYANDAALRALGVRVSPDAPDGAFIWDIFDRESSALYDDVIEAALRDGGVWRGELMLEGVDGRGIPVSTQLLAHAEDGIIESVSIVARDITDVRAAQEQLRHLATHDKLTGLANRALLYDRLDGALARAHRVGAMVALLYFDLDHFKPVNDEHGHDAGDAVLVEIAVRIGQVVRDTDTAARVGGDEFVVLVEGARDRQLVEVVAQRLLESICRPIAVGHHEVQVSASIGLVIAPDGCEDADHLMGVADRAMYRAKAGGRRRVEVIELPGE